MSRDDINLVVVVVVLFQIVCYSIYTILDNIKYMCSGNKFATPIDEKALKPL